LNPNPYASPLSSSPTRQKPNRSVIERIGFLIAAVPALYSATILLLCIFGGIAKLLGFVFDFQNPLIQLALLGGIYATLAQLPLYIGWALISKEIPWTTRLHWVGLLWIANMFSIPCFLFAKYYRIAHRLPFAGGAGRRSFEVRPSGSMLCQPGASPSDHREQ
jgi:hypothetical protein